jgi:hypothetical protein
MEHSSNDYLIELVFDKNNRWNMRSSQDIDSIHFDNHTEVYRSMYGYPHSAIDILKQYKLVGKPNAGVVWAGPMIADDIIVDLDLKLFNDDELLWQAEQYWDAIARFCPTTNFAIYNSGTGLHVHFDKKLFNIAPSVHVPKITKHIALSIERHIALTMPCKIDQSIYHSSACYRMAGSVNPKTRTRKKLVGGKYPFGDTEPLLEYMGVYALHEIKTSMATPTIEPKSNGNYPAVTPCMTKLWELGFKHAKDTHGRHNTVLALASWMLFNNMPKDIAASSIIGWIEASGFTYDKRDTIRCINEAYARKVRFGCHSDILQPYCMTHCKLYDRKNATSSKIY